MNILLANTILSSRVHNLPLLAIIALVVLIVVAWKMVGTVLRAAVKLALLAAVVLAIVILAPQIFGTKNGNKIQANVTTSAKDIRACAHNLTQGNLSSKEALKRCLDRARKQANKIKSK